MITTMIAVYDRVAKRWSHPMPVDSVDAFKRDMKLSLAGMDDTETLKACKEDYDVYVLGFYDDTCDRTLQPFTHYNLPEFAFALDELGE